jgi:hypothetical protein
MNKVIKTSIVSILSALGIATSFSSAYALFIKDSNEVSFIITQKVEETTIKRFYLTNNYNWTDVYSYIWNSSTEDNMGTWPGNNMTWLYNNDYGQGVFYIDVDMALYDYVIFTNNNGQQTINISLNDAIDGGYNAYYISGGSNNSLTVGTWTYSD